jgi:hypothetical protein
MIEQYFCFFFKIQLKNYRDLFHFQYCQLLAYDFGRINPKIRPLVKKFGCAYYPFIEAVLRRHLLQNSNQKFEFIQALNSLFLPTMEVFMWITHFKKVPPLFGHFLKNLQIIRSLIFPAANIFMRPLLCFAAQISASWQHCSFYRLV